MSCVDENVEQTDDTEDVRAPAHEENLTSTGGLMKKLRFLISDSGPDDVEATRFLMSRQSSSLLISGSKVRVLVRPPAKLLGYKSK